MINAVPLDPKREPNQAFFKQLNGFQMSLKSFSQLEAMLEQIVFLGRDIVGANDVSVVLWDKNSSKFINSASTNQTGNTVAKRVRKRGGATRWIIDNKQKLIVSDARNDPFTANDMIVESGIGAYAGVPIMRNGQVLGVLYSLFHQKREIVQIEIKKLEEIALVVAAAISQMLDIQSLKNEADLMSSVLRKSMLNLVQPLSLIVGFCDLLLDEEQALSADQRKRIDIIKRSNSKMEKLITETQRFDNLVNCYELNIESVCLNNLAFTVQKMLNQYELKNEGKVQVSIDTSIPKVQGDFGLLVDVVKELAENSLRYSGDKSITIRTENLSQYVLIAIKDHGVGMTQLRLDTIFDPFVCYPVSTSNERLGLGLTYVKVIVEKHGGYVEVESQVEKGSEFRLFLPKLD